MIDLLGDAFKDEVKVKMVPGEKISNQSFGNVQHKAKQR